LAPQLEELDLSGNLLSSWAEVEAVVGALPKLTALNLTANRMSSPQGALPTALRLRVLVLNQTDIQWEQMTALGRSLPSLAQLYLNANAISVLRDSGEPPIQVDHPPKERVNMC
jgi:Leucine-rich repeat (LRR) protein